MRLVSFRHQGGGNSFGVVIGDEIADCGAVMGGYDSLREVLEGQMLHQLETAAEGALRHRLDQVTLLPPIPQPDKILCVGLNYAAHIKETGREPQKYPAIFTRYPSSVVGQGEALERPSVSSDFDFEGELAVVIGKIARYVSAAEAKDYIAGYTCFNDGSIRDFQAHSSQFWPGKSFYRSGAMGPWIVTPDELTDIQGSHLRTILNGQEMQTAPISDLAFGIAEIIEYLSQVTELLPGDVIATGTPGGVGKYRNPPVFMKAGDVVEVEISGIGSLRNPVIEGA